MIEDASHDVNEDFLKVTVPYIHSTGGKDRAYAAPEAAAPRAWAEWAVFARRRRLQLPSGNNNFRTPDFDHIVSVQFDVFSLGYRLIVDQGAIGAVQVFQEISVLNFLDHRVLTRGEIVVYLDVVAFMPAYGNGTDQGLGFSLVGKPQYVKFFIVL
jgi:hypothetical protein